MKATTCKVVTKKEGDKFYGGVEFNTGNIQDTIWVGVDTDTRGKARTIGTNRMKAMKTRDRAV